MEAKHEDLFQQNIQVKKERSPPGYAEIVMSSKWQRRRERAGADIWASGSVRPHWVQDGGRRESRCEHRFRL
jgi:hypothetical protein